MARGFILNPLFFNYEELTMSINWQEKFEELEKDIETNKTKEKWIKKIC